VPPGSNEERIMRQEIIELYDSYTHEYLDRRTFMDRLVKLTGGTTAAAAALAALKPNYALAQMVPANDPKVKAERITYPGAGGTTMKGYLAAPAAATGKLPALIIVHENRGLNPHIEDVARRAALEGFLALAPDFLSPQGGTPANEEQAMANFRQIDLPLAIQNSVATVAHLKDHGSSTGKVGIMGFCWGGGMVNQTAVNAADLRAGVVFYGRQPAAADVPKIKAKLLFHYAGLDEPINGGIAAYEDALRAAKVTFVSYVYPNVNHAFHNDTSEARYNKDAATLAWGRSMLFLRSQLG